MGVGVKKFFDPPPHFIIVINHGQNVSSSPRMQLSMSQDSGPWLETISPVPHPNLPSPEKYRSAATFYLLPVSHFCYPPPPPNLFLDRLGEVLPRIGRNAYSVHVYTVSVFLSLRLSLSLTTKNNYFQKKYIIISCLCLCA